MDFSEIDRLVDDLDKCGDQYCGKIITRNQMKEEELKFLDLVNKNCRSKTNPRTEEEYNKQMKHYDNCLAQLKSKSNYHKRLTLRKKCEDQQCKMIQEKIQKALSKPKAKPAAKNTTKKMVKSKPVKKVGAKKSVKSKLLTKVGGKINAKK